MQNHPRRRELCVLSEAAKACLYQNRRGVDDYGYASARAKVIDIHAE
jgi:hypothetical protein